VLLAVALAAVCTAYYLNTLLRNRFTSVILELSEVNAGVRYDINMFLSEIPACLKTIFVKDFAYNISYAGTNHRKELSCTDPFIFKSYDDGDLRLSFTMVPYFCRGGLKYLYALVLDYIFLTIETDVLMKIRMLNDTFTNVLRVQVFVQHDIKNIAQFIQTSYYNLQNLKDEADELRYVRYLKDSYSPLMLKANKIINTLNLRPSDAPAVIKNIDIKDVIEKLISLYHLKCEITGEGSVYANEGTIFLIFDNLIKNMYDKFLDEELDLSIEIIDEPDKIRVMAIDTGSHIADMERIFEPFYSTKTGGSGIGLFQVRAHVSKLGGTVTAQNVENGVRFEITLPKADG
jgi:hypothetical protein